VLTSQTVAALNLALTKAPMPWHLDWSALKTVEDTAVLPLARLFGGWAAQPVQLRFLGSHQLENILKTTTPSGQPSVSQDNWKLRLEALRVMHRPDEFELMALDFCVTYEVSPPAWEMARCEFKSLDASEASHGGHTIIGEAAMDSIPSVMSSTYGDTEHGSSGQYAQMGTVELSGQIQGDPVEVLAKLEARLMGADVMIISCAKLIRVDFSAAGTLLNWVSARQSEGRAVQFSDVNRMVAAFFHVIGISEHARVLCRKD
jgi:ABC-type transporter Mla MlaB component